MRCRYLYPLSIASLFVILFGLSLAFSWLYGIWIVTAGIWIIFGFAWSFICKNVRRLNQRMELEDKKFENLRKFLPFRSEDDWHKHKNLLKPLYLPDYDPKLHNQDVRKKSKKWQARKKWFDYCLCLIFDIVSLPIQLLWALIKPTTKLKVYLITEK